MKTQITVIVPLYNAEKYVDRCLNSLLHQTYSDFKIILVNDGSTDRTGMMCREYAKKDSRIDYIEQSNKGGGAARNAGLNLVRTPYVVFLDSDDELPLNTIEIYMGMIGMVDLIIGGILKENCGKVTRFRPKYKEINDKKSMTHMVIKDGYWVNPPWNKLYKTAIIQEQKISFHDFKYGEDTYFVYSYLKYAKTVCLIEDPVYVVHAMEGSMSRRKVPDIWICMCKIFENGRELAPDDAWFVYMLLLRSIKTSLLLKTRESRQSFMEACEQMYQYVLKCNIDRKVRGGIYNKCVLQLLLSRKCNMLYVLMKARIIVNTLLRR